MAGFRVRGGEIIRGSARIAPAKNAVLPIMAASVLARGETILRPCPGISDVRHMADILNGLGCGTRFQNGALSIHTEGMDRWIIPDEMSKKIRSSIFLIGPLLGRMRRATAAYPGGCEIGIRPIDLHLAGLKDLGVTVREEGGLLYCDGEKMHAADVCFDYPSVGATENVMLAAVLLSGTTTIHNVAREPEIEDLQNFVNRMGGRVSGAGTQVITVEGVQALHAVEYTPIPDRIVAGTCLAAAAITGGSITLENVRAADMVAVLTKFRQMGCDISEEKEKLQLRAPMRLRAFPLLQTQPHPGFPTDMQVQMLALASVANGTSIIVENVFENRFTHAGDLNRMGANIRLNGRAAIVQGVESLKGARVTARDLRGGAALVLAGLKADGETIIENAELVDRGYENFDLMLAALGGKIERITD